ncbi:MAG: ABC-2 type transport system permease protein [Candidatus Pseudothioglobus sp.]|jgi:ABC-2 type transport system permease protein
MKVLKILLKREFWEHRKTFFYLPLVIMAFCTFFLFAGIGSLQILGDDLMIDGHAEMSETTENSTDQQVYEYSSVPVGALFGEQLAQFGVLPFSDKEKVLNMAYFTFVSPLAPVLWGVIFMYFLTCLYDDRKDRSILFWKSLPVSDTMTVLSKLLTGLVVLPVIFFVAMLMLQLILLLASVLFALGYPIDTWEALVAPANIVGRWFSMAAFLGFVTLWCLPFFAWVILISSWAKSVPLAWVIGGPVVVVIFEQVFFRSDIVTGYIGRHIFPGDMMSRLAEGVTNVYGSLMNLEFLVSIVLAAAMLSGAVYFRSKADEL